MGLLDVILSFDKYELKNPIKQKLETFAKTYKSLLADYELMPLGEFANEVVKRFEIKSAYDASIEEEYFKQMNIDQLCASVNEFASKNVEMGLEDYLESVTLMSDIDTMDDSNNVTLATVHSVKGLEFPVVFVVGVEDGIFPISRAFNNPDDIEEERRLMYVAMTRAEERLFISFTSSRYMFNRRNYSRPSRFLFEIGYSSHFSSRVKEYENSKYDFSAKADYKESFASTSSVEFDKIKSQVMTKATLEEEKPQKDISKYRVGQKVEHTRYGLGTIIQINGKDADIKFESVGLKTLILTLAPLEIVE